MNAGRHPAGAPTPHPSDDDEGCLLLAATPMGQVEDASPRLRAALASADIVAAEDTRRARALANALEVSIGGKLVSYYDQVEASRTPGLVGAVSEGATVLLITDAGMPSVSDPGYRIVAACAQAGLRVTCLPGPSAVTTALAVSALPSERFCFDGFAPRRPGARRDWLAGLADQPRTTVFFDSPHRLADTLADAVDVLGPDRRAAVCRELTKTYEEIRRGTLAELAQWASDGVRGEITVVVEGAIARAPDATELVDEVERLVAGGMRLKDACAQVTHAGGASRREVYQAVLERRRQEPDR
ncbi:16S rRNA (cytidine(1402)-2'-O)-methyltransferase [Gordonia aquimaris]|uniref:Ribosomal RNA small subunit methyltransferase I n=1 Tax=Gordonia aquimaris TaxID=2984863 RepID=A0A9X3D0U1_9ACTN|nr:16S rRNA (cytidine(1402)-2'-O)-methyltransferase [Gordonia aquimaris]MCX2962695.1 16S rRNA (cytidine(1402)-2'-O)-methyltransferase [Gordonia aquimaris]